MGSMLRAAAAASTLTLITTLAGAPAPAAARAAGPGHRAPAAVPAAGYRVTLLTGDTVTLASPGGPHPRIMISPGRGRAGLPFHLTGIRTGGHQDVSVIPADAAGLITAGRLDPQLFDVSLLARDGYHSACAAARHWPVPGAQPAAPGAARLGSLPSAWPTCGTGPGFPAAPAADTGAGQAGRTFPVRIRVLDRAGVPLPPPDQNLTPPYSVLGTVVNTATGAAVTTASYSRKAGAYVVRLPAGHYYIDGMALAAGYPAGVAQPDVPVRGSTTVTLDARAAVPVITKVSQPGAKTLIDQVEIDQTVAGSPVSSAYGMINSPGQIEPFYFTPTVPVTGRPFLYSLHASLTTPGAFPTGLRRFHPASYEYNLLFTHRGAVPASLDYHVADSQLATVYTRYYTQHTVPHGVDLAQEGNLPLGPGNELYLSFDSPVVIPRAGRATLYFSAAPQVTWFRNLLIANDTCDPADVAPEEAFTAGHSYQRSFDAAALAPAGRAERQGNTLISSPAPFSPSEPGHYMPALDWEGFDNSAVHTTLSLDGKVIGSTSFPSPTGFQLPAARGRYTLAEEARRPASGWSVLGTRSTAVWSFFSAHQAGTAAAALPLLTVRATGPFSSSGTASAGKAFPLTLTVEEMPAGAHLTSLRLSMSANGGKTWRPVHLYRAGGHWLALVTSPPGGGYVSLRTAAADSAGDSALTTTIRAYATVPGTRAGG